VLPIPHTVVIAALGIIYGTLLGGLLGTLGLITGGLLGYGLMLTSARRFAQRLAGPRSLHKMENLFDRGGAWAIVLAPPLRTSRPRSAVLPLSSPRLRMRHRRHDAPWERLGATWI
jgi:membrane protein DedA with SNARE-associated domain